jgi:hypothetical protein
MNMPTKTLIALILLCRVMSYGQPTPGAPPATAPATTPVRYVLVMPPGFKAVAMGNHTAIVEPTDEAWVRETLQTLAPTTLPSTMPANLLEKLAANRESLRAQMVTDLGLTDPSIVDKFFRETLEAQLKRYDEIAPPLFYMVTTGERLKQLVKDGWSNPRFYYNRAADDVQMSPAVNLSSDGPGDDVLIPVIVKPEEATDVKRKRLADTIHQIEAQLAARISQDSQARTQLAFIGFFASDVLEPLKARPEQEWFGVGMSNLLSARYLAQLNGMDLPTLLHNMTADLPPRVNPIRPGNVDLLNPTPLSDMRAEAIPYYVDAYRRKATRVVASWSTRGGEGSIAKVLTAMRKQMPADGDGLVKLIQQISGIDLTPELRPTG